MITDECNQLKTLSLHVYSKFVKVKNEKQIYK